MKKCILTLKEKFRDGLNTKIDEILSFVLTITGIGDKTLEWDERNLLSKNNLSSRNGEVTYQYDYQKVLAQSYIRNDNTLRKYYMDGNKILGEDWYNYYEGQGIQDCYSKFRYYYSATGYVGFSVDGIYYSVLVD